jgi:uncharacterized protein YjbI with pentapeptide repeats
MIEDWIKAFDAHIKKYALPPKHLEQVLADHERWIETEGAEGKPLSEDDTEPTIEGLCLDAACLRRVRLVGSSLHACSLIGADLTQGQLALTGWRACDLTGASFEGADLSLSHFSEDCIGLETASFEGANIGGATIPGVTRPRQQGFGPALDDFFFSKEPGAF